jgi:hypothetical protein
MIIYKNMEELRKKITKMYIISNNDYNYTYLHTDGNFYNCIVNVGGCKLVTYKNLKSAQNKSNNIYGSFVIEVEIGKPLREGVVVR